MALENAIIIEEMNQLASDAAKIEIIPLDPSVSRQSQPKAQKPKNTIFIGHGHYHLDAVGEIPNQGSQSRCGEFNNQSAAGLSFKERLEQMLSNADFAFIIMTAEDQYADGVMHAHENVIHETGLCQGKLGFEKAIILLEEGCAEFSNKQGLVHHIVPEG